MLPLSILSTADHGTTSRFVLWHFTTRKILPTKKNSSLSTHTIIASTHSRPRPDPNTDPHPKISVTHQAGGGGAVQDFGQNWLTA